MVEHRTIKKKYPYTETLLPSGYRMTQEIYVNNGVAATTGRWGDQVENPEGVATGFPILWQSTTPLHSDYDTNLALLLDDELTVGALAINKTLEALKWLPEDVHTLIIGNGLLTERSIDYASKLVQRADLPLKTVDHNSGSSSYSDACASWMKAFHFAMRNPNLQGKKVLVCDVEHITREMALGRLNADALSKNVFSN